MAFADNVTRMKLAEPTFDPIFHEWVVRGELRNVLSAILENDDPDGLIRGLRAQALAWEEAIGYVSILSRLIGDLSREQRPAMAQLFDDLLRAQIAAHPRYNGVPPFEIGHLLAYVESRLIDARDDEIDNLRLLRKALRKMEESDTSRRRSNLTRFLSKAHIRSWESSMS
ncbi:MAG: hypothetical protein AAF772_08310 [Acidobacteriota bacterium]